MQLFEKVSTFLTICFVMFCLQKPILPEEVIQSLLPTTLIDLRKQAVHHTRVYHEYIHMRREYMNLEMEKLLLDGKKRNKEAFPRPTTVSSLFSHLREPSPIVDHMLTEVVISLSLLSLSHTITYLIPSLITFAYTSAGIQLTTRNARSIHCSVDALANKEGCHLN